MWRILAPFQIFIKNLSLTQRDCDALSFFIE